MPHPLTGHKHAKLNSVEVNILIGGGKMKSPLARTLRFLGGFVVVVITCLVALDRAVLREQLILLSLLATAAGLICAFSDRALKAVSDHWTF